MALLISDNYAASGPISLTAFTTGDSDTVECNGCRDMSIVLTLAGSPADVVYVAGSSDNVNWDNLDVTDSNTTISAAGSTRFIFDGAAPRYVKVVKVSGTTSVAAVVDFGAYG